MNERVVFGEDGLRIAGFDLDGAPQHELTWDRTGAVPRLVRARLRLDWGQWVSLVPGGLSWTDRFFIGSMPGWRSMDHPRLVRVAADLLCAREADVGFYYGPDDLRLDADGWVTVRHRKDALYAAPGEGRFPRFLACMAKVSWGRIDSLPVMHLYQSLLPGLGHAVFTLIRGLRGDQGGDAGPRLRYRGIPAYPSISAFRLFSRFFEPTLASGEDPLTVFLDPARSAEVVWRSARSAPVRRERSPQAEAAWRALFPDGPPSVPEGDSCWAVPRYRADGRRLAEPATQHLAVEQARQLLAGLPRRPDRVLIHGWDCGAGDLTRAGAGGTVLFRRPAFAIREARRLSEQSGERPIAVSFRAAGRRPIYPAEHDALCVWIPFACYRSAATCRAWVARVAGALRPGDHAVVSGPRLLGDALRGLGVEVAAVGDLMTGPGADVLRPLLPRLAVHPEATMFMVRR